MKNETLLKTSIFNFFKYFFHRLQVETLYVSLKKLRH